MRIELALIVGIVFFCCWCAYIIVKMSSSVPNPPSSALNQRENIGSQSGQGYLANTYANPHMISPNLSQHYNHNYPIPQHYVTSPYLMNQAHLIRHPEANSPVAAYRRPSAAEAQRTQTNRPATRWRPALIGEHYLASPSLSATTGLNPNLSAEEEQESDDNQTSDESIPESADEQGAHADTDQPDQQSDYPTDGQLEEPEADVPASGQHLEERVDRRAYDELASQSNERDRNGKTIQKHQRHLVNGRPVGSKQSPDDFERVVDEIDEANKTQQQSPANDYDESPSESSNTTSAIIPALPESRSDEDSQDEDTTPKPSVDEHEHRLVESLKAQQWDDDSSRPTDAGAKPGSKFSKRANLEQETTTVLPDDSVVDFKDLDLFADSDRFPFMNEQQRQRKKRQIQDYNEVRPMSALVDEASANMSAYLSHTPLLEPTNTSGQVQLVEIAPAMEPSMYNLQPDNDLTRGNDRFPEVVKVEPVPQANSSLWYQDSHRLADADRQFYGPQIGAIFPVKQPEPAGSKSKSKKVKKVNSMKKKNKSGSHHKYKAAKAHSMKRKRQSKKGNLGKKRQKAKKKVANGYKEFIGSTKGNKLAKGDGHKGAKKGVLFFKDKGYKKRGFKRAYQKLESGDHKTYFDEFRDKDHKKKWKNYKDKHNYSHSKKWAGKDKKKYNHYNLKEARDKKSKSGAWSEKKASKMKKGMNYKGGDEYESGDRKKKKKKLYMKDYD